MMPGRCWRISEDRKQLEVTRKLQTVKRPPFTGAAGRNAIINNK